MDTEYVRSRFIKHFDGTTGFLYASPGRINLIGEHTDYNGGFVFPGAVDKGMIAEIKPNGTDKVKAYSIDLKDYVEFGLNEEDAPRASLLRTTCSCRDEFRTSSYLQFRNHPFPMPRKHRVHVGFLRLHILHAYSLQR